MEIEKAIKYYEKRVAIEKEQYAEFEGKDGGLAVFQPAREIRIERDELALTALREQQEREKPVGFISEGYGIYLCGACERPVRHIDAFCKHCGRRLKEAQEDGHI